MTSDQPSSPLSPCDAALGDDPAASTERQDDAQNRVDARRIRELRATTGRLVEKVATAAAQLDTVAEQLKQAGRQHTDLAAAVSEDLAPRVSATSRPARSCRT
jgi:hypothetical protein